jgi:hypothetical protein
MTRMSVGLQASPPGRRPAPGAVAAFALALAGSAVLGLVGGLIWGEAAPRPMLQEISNGTAQLVNAETTAFIGADAWFVGISVVAGLITGLVGYRFLVSRAEDGARAAAAAGLILGAVAAALIMMWVGGQIGLSGYNEQLATSPKGTLFPASLSLGAKSALVFWPMFTAIVILIADWGTRRQDTAEDDGPAGTLPGYAQPPE